MLFILIPGGMLLILAGVAWMWFAESISQLAIAAIILGFSALGGAIKIIIVLI